MKPGARLAGGVVLSALLGCALGKSEAPASPAGPAPEPPRAAREAAPRLWSAAGSFTQGRFEGEMRKLRDGRVLLAGGLIGTAKGLADVDLFDPATGRWTPGAPLRQGRYEFASVALADGRILVSGGIGPNGTVIRTAEIYDPRADSWTAAAPMARIRQGHQLVLLPDGRILAAGGYDGAATLSGAELYDPERDSWSDAGRMTDGRLFPMMVVLSNGKILISGGSGYATCDLYDPKTNRWTATGSMSTTRYFHRGVTLPDGRVLVTGGGGEGKYRASSEIYDPRAGRWTPAAPMGTARHGHAMVLVSGTPLVIGGSNLESALDSTELYDAAADAWRAGPALGVMRAYPHVAVLDDGRVLAAGGRRGLLNAMPLTSSELLSATGPFARTFAAAPVEDVRAPARAVYAAPLDDPESLPAPVAVRPRAHAVVIGIERYRQGLPRADFAAGDAKLTAEYFRRVLGVPDENLALLGDELATKSDFEKYFERWLPNRVEKGDDVYVYFSGHGSPNAKTGETYLVPYDADPSYIEQTGYPIKKMYAQLAKLPARRVYVVMDSCFSGAGGRSVIAEGVRPLVSVVHSDVPRGLIVISASAGDQISNSYREKRHGLFTYFFLKGLKGKRGDLRAAFDYLKPQVARVARRELNADQDPQWRKGE